MMDKRQTGKRTDQQKEKNILKDSETKRQTDSQTKDKKKKRKI